MKTIYKTTGSKNAALELYNAQLTKLGYPYKDIFVNTSFGETHLIETGNLSGKPLLVFHGGNSTTSYNLLACQFLLSDFRIYAVDIIGLPGKSAEICLSPNGYSYGKWANEVVSRLGFEKIRCFGGSFGGGVLAKFMCVAPNKIEKSVLVVPSGINNAFPIGSIKMTIPLLKYLCTKNDIYIKQTALFMSITEDVLDTDTLDTVKNSFDHVKTKAGMPSNVSAKLMRQCHAPTLVMASEKDCLFPAKKVLKRAKTIIPNAVTYELKNRGHMHLLTEEEKTMIIEFLK
ncbi:alpha/beta fold hydrolase [Anaerorhabdus sp.]|uniref:alpha/beta fold hydrolase n=1 Tax=Anaerorhabdus sp. TaxID=1872524 RepID=UPI002FCC21E8